MSRQMMVLVSLLVVACGPQGKACECGDFCVGGNIYTPYAIEITDCALAEKVARESTDPWGGVWLENNGCRLQGEGDEARYECNYDDGLGMPGAIAEGGAPIRDGDGRIPGLIFVGFGGQVNYQVRLLTAGAAQVAGYCGPEDVGTLDYCGVLYTDFVVRRVQDE